MKSRTVSIAKGAETYVFQYQPGSEGEMLDEFERLADSPESELDWVDAATLSFQVARQTAAACQLALLPHPHQKTT